MVHEISALLLLLLLFFLLFCLVLLPVQSRVVVLVDHLLYVQELFPFECLHQYEIFYVLDHVRVYVVEFLSGTKPLLFLIRVEVAIPYPHSLLFIHSKV